MDPQADLIVRNPMVQASTQPMIESDCLNWYKTRLRSQVRFWNPVNDKRRAIWLRLAAEWGKKQAEALKRFKVDEKYDQSPMRRSSPNRGNWLPNQDDVIFSMLCQLKERITIELRREDISILAFKKI